MQGLSFISGRAAVICYLGERGSGGYLVIKTALEIHREAATMEKKARCLCVRESVDTHSKSEITFIFKQFFLFKK